MRIHLKSVVMRININNMHKDDTKIASNIFLQALIIQLHGDGFSLAKVNLLVYYLVSSGIVLLPLSKSN